MKILSIVLFRFSRSVVEPVGTIGDLCSFWGSLLLFWFHSQTLIVSG